MAVRYFYIKKDFSLEENSQDSLSTEDRLVLGLSFLAVVVVILLLFLIVCSSYDAEEARISHTTPIQVAGDLPFIEGIEARDRCLDKAQQHAWELNNESVCNDRLYNKWTFV